MALGGGIAIMIASNQTTARVGADPQTLDASGNLTIAASGSFSVDSLADATADASGSVGLGASVVVNVSQDSFLAELGRNATVGGAVSITDDATASSQAAAVASEKGADPAASDSSTGSDGTADRETQNQSDYAHAEGGSDSPGRLRASQGERRDELAFDEGQGRVRRRAAATRKSASRRPSPSTS